jgi:hypothetical protein
MTIKKPICSSNSHISLVTLKFCSSYLNIKNYENLIIVVKSLCVSVIDILKISIPFGIDLLSNWFFHLTPFTLL